MSTLYTEGMKRKDLVEYLDAFLEIGTFEGLDRSLNGLVVGGEEREVNTIAFAVDACQQTFDEAVAAKADFLIVHHGLFWGSPLALTKTHYQRVKTLIEGNLDLYVAHLPLDAHPVVGNNVVMANRLGLVEMVPFAPYKGKPLGFKGKLEEPKTIQELAKALDFTDPMILGFGKRVVSTVGIVSGGASDDVHEAIAECLDCFITGEVEHQVYHDCRENHITLLGGGHYQSEVFGVQELARHLNEQFGLQTMFVANPTGL